MVPAGSTGRLGVQGPLVSGGREILRGRKRRDSLHIPQRHLVAGPHELAGAGPGRADQPLELQRGDDVLVARVAVVVQLGGIVDVGPDRHDHRSHLARQQLVARVEVDRLLVAHLGALAAAVARSLADLRDEMRRVDRMERPELFRREHRFAAAPAAAQYYNHQHRHYNQPPRQYHGGTHHHYHNHHNYGWVGPAIGGAIIGGIIVDQYYRSPPTYYTPPPAPYGYREESQWDYYCGCYRTVMVPY